MQTEERFWYADGLDREELEFQRRYGPVQQPTRARATAHPGPGKEFFDGFGRPWWLVDRGVHRSLPASRGPRRLHMARDVAALAAYAEGRYHVWAAGAGGFIRPVTVDQPEMPRPERSGMA
jgi:hypothetical protein